MRDSGVMMAPKDQFTAQGWDLQFGTNTIGPFFLTKLLTPLLIETAKECPPGTVRVVNTGSSAQHWSPIHFDALKAGSARDKLCDERLYGQSKHVNKFLPRTVDLSHILHIGQHRIFPGVCETIR